MVKLAEQFPRATFSVRKSDLIYLAMRHLEATQFASVIDRFIADAKFAPSVAEFKDASRAFKASQEKINSGCSICGGGGILSCYARKTGINYAFACTCINGYDYTAFQKWGEQNQNHFSRIAPHKIFMKGRGNPYEGKVLHNKKTVS